LATIAAGTSGDFAATPSVTVLDWTTQGSFAAIFNAIFSSPSIQLSSSVKAATTVTATVSFTVVTTGTNIKTLTVSGVNFDSTVQPTSSITCTGLSSGTASLSSDGKTLVLSVGTPAAASPTSIVCQFAGLKNDANPKAAISSVAISSFDSANNPIDSVSSVVFPSIVNAVLTGASVELSSSVARDAVNATVKFKVTTQGSINVVSVTGVNFDSSVQPTSVTCTGLGASTASLSGTNTLKLTVTAPQSVAAAADVSCLFANLKNVAYAAASTSAVSITTWNADTSSAANIDGINFVSFPAIFSRPQLTTNVNILAITGDRGVGAAVVAVVSFKPTTALPIGGKITLNYPSGFFATTATPSANADGTASVATMTATSAFATDSIVITTAVAGIASDANFVITLSGLVLGAATAGSTTGITVQTDADTLASAGSPSGGIFTRPTAVKLTIAASQRKPTQAGVAVTLTFTNTALLDFGGKITLMYPNGFFATSATPEANAAGTTSVSGMTATSSAPTTNSIVISTFVGRILANTDFTITLRGLTMGAATPGSTTGIKVQTNATDTIQSVGFPSGGIGTTSVTQLSVSSSSTVRASTANVVIRFTPATQVTAGGSIVFGFPTGWFDKTVAPGNTTSSVTGLTTTSAIDDNSITLTTASAAIPTTAVFTITLSGLKTGPSAVAAGKFSLATSVDVVAAEVDAPALTATAPLPPPPPPPSKSPATSVAVSAFLLLASAFALLL
jgi:hypothetical protein